LERPWPKVSSYTGDFWPWLIQTACAEERWHKMIEYDSGFEYPRKLANTIELPDEGGRKVIYTASVWDIRFEGTDAIRGGASIQKRVVMPKPDRSRFNLWTWRFERVPAASKDEVAWEFTTSRDSIYIISGGAATGFTNSAHHKGRLIGVAATEGVLLTGTLLETVFASIEKELLGFQRIVRQHGLQIVAA